MVPMSSDKASDYTPTEQAQLLALARASIAHGVTHETVLRPSLQDYSERLRAMGASFVTLHLDGELRGCIGTLEAHQPLVLDVAHNAHAAAFKDPRFLPVSAAELARLEIHISVLNPAEEIQVQSQQDLVQQLRPGVDGVIIQEGTHRGTFLPSVWDQLPEPAQFLAHLKLKAGLSAGYWSPSMKVWRYTTTSFPSD
mgnify:CR=1 FL=1